MGLLDQFSEFAKTPEGQGLLSAAFGGLAGARRGTPLNNIGRAGIAGLTGYGSAQDRITQEAEAAQARELRAMQTAKYRRDMTADEAAANEKQRVEDLIRTTFLPVTGTNANARTGITGPRPEAAEAIGSTPAVDWQQMIAMGVPFERVKQLAESKNLGRNKVARTAEVEGPDGSKRIVQLDDFGGEIGSLAGYTAPVQINQGDRVTFAKPTPGQSFGINETPDGRAGRAVTMRGQNMTDARARERFAFDQQGGAGGKAPPGYRFTANGNMEAIPGGPADLKASAAGAAKAKDANEALAVIAEAEQLIPKSTGSGVGAIADSTMGFFGFAPPGAQAGARLKALEGMLVSKMPKMTGPQSDKDVLLYKQMAGQIGDTSIPVSARMAAIETIKRLQEQYGGAAMPQSSGASGGWAPADNKSGWSIQRAD